MLLGPPGSALSGHPLACSLGLSNGQSCWAKKMPSTMNLSLRDSNPGPKGRQTLHLSALPGCPVRPVACPGASLLLAYLNDPREPEAMKISQDP